MDFMGDFPVKKCYYLQMEGEGENDASFEKFVWKKNIPPKVSFMLWACFHDSLSTLSMLQHRGVEIQSVICPICKREVEDSDHLLVSCSYAFEVWTHFINSFKVSWFAPNTVKGFFEAWSLNNLPGRCKEVWWKTIYGVIWHLWKERSKRVHNGGRHKEAAKLIMIVKQTIALSFFDKDVFRGFSVNQILFQWDTILHT
ncbi:uncharacterized protein LOC113273413 [Papaver somniferum]|uniref:uncharacterized protein LOC113273413 n=1 Tax=Papaver somniferum TaxID=3469 RepID=UPI000E6F9FEA|nr:uncharacterized protein LOC113273413 [Papaver somniferum]